MPTLSGPVTSARSDVDVIVTEFGAAELKGQTLAERTRLLQDHAEQLILLKTEDFAEGTRAVSEARAGNFKGR